VISYAIKLATVISTTPFLLISKKLIKK
jgi:hypothetical protein